MIMDKIHFSYKKSRDQHDLFDSRNMKYDCVLTYKNKSIMFPFQYPKHEEVDRDVVLYHILREASYVDNLSLAQFLVKFHYNDTVDSLEDGFQAWRKCKEIAKQVNSLFTEKEIINISLILEEYFEEMREKNNNPEYDEENYCIAN